MAFMVSGALPNNRPYSAKPRHTPPNRYKIRFIIVSRVGLNGHANKTPRKGAVMEKNSSNGWKFFAILFGALLAGVVGLYVYKQAETAAEAA